MKILKFPDPKLFIKAMDVAVFDDPLRSTLEEMWETMVSANGIGLSANQVGLDNNMFVMMGQHGEKLFLINPVLKDTSLRAVKFPEGCLSAPGELVERSDRSEWVWISYRTELGDYKKDIFVGVQAICVQHEMEHLRGESFLESLSIDKKERKRLKKKWGIKSEDNKGSLPKRKENA